MNLINKKPPVCTGCLYPPDNKRALLMFESVDAMLRFMITQYGNGDASDIEDYNDDQKGFLLRCPTWECSRGFDVESIEDLTRVFNWSPEDIDPNSEEYVKRIQVAKTKSSLTVLELLGLALTEK